MPKPSTTIRAMVMTMLWIRSVVDTARKPPMMVYRMTTAAPISMEIM